MRQEGWDADRHRVGMHGLMRGDEGSENATDDQTKAREGADLMPRPKTKEARYRLMAEIRFWRASPTRVCVVNVTLDDWYADEGVVARLIER